ncbi:MAG: LacI family DNA-binding transcriptional regulator [Anaerolineaceae bacterium]|nr:LacI family DNA-binding transcriptional regulator [Anaerolineaceae bacterium]
MNKKVRIQDIADALGISRNTVSKAINNSEGLADETREKILQKAIEMGYKQFSYVRNIAELAMTQAANEDGGISEFKGEIALFTTIFINPSHFATLLLDRFQRELLQLGYTLNTHRVDIDNLKNKTLPITFSKERARAIICFEMFDWEYDEMLCTLGLPTLFVDGPCRIFGKALPSDQLLMDNTVGISKLIMDMLQAGKKRIGFIGNYEHCESFFERYMAFLGTMMLNNEPVNKKWIIKENHKEMMIKPFRNMKELPDLFICANDFVAIDAMQVLRDMGKGIPQDVMIAGFDDSVDSRLVDPQLTTVHIHSQIMAYSATQLLISRIEEPTLDYRTIYTETELIYRKSASI